MAETGVIGLGAFVWALVTIFAALLSFRSVMHKAPANAIWYATAFLVASIAGLLPISTSIDAAPGNLYFWFFLGVVIRLYDLERGRLQMLPAQTGIGAGTPGMRVSYPVSYQ